MRDLIVSYLTLICVTSYLLHDLPDRRAYGASQGVHGIGQDGLYCLKVIARQDVVDIHLR